MRRYCTSRTQGVQPARGVSHDRPSPGSSIRQQWCRHLASRQAMELVGDAAQLFADLTKLLCRYSRYELPRCSSKLQFTRIPHKMRLSGLTTFLKEVRQSCLEYELNYTSDMAKRIIDKPALKT